MDILNFISWIKGGRQVTTVDASKTLIPLGLKDNRRDDGYLAGAISVEDFAAQIAPQPAYKVYTALLTQNGGNGQQNIESGDLTIGVTYRIIDQAGGTWDFTNVGAPNNNIDTYFVATGTTPNSWGNGILSYNTGAPVVTVLENTIGNIWFTYSDAGIYKVDSSGLFTDGKTFIVVVAGLNGRSDILVTYITNTDSNIILNSYRVLANTLVDDALLNTSIEIRVYN